MAAPISLRWARAMRVLKGATRYGRVYRPALTRSYATSDEEFNLDELFAGLPAFQKRGPSTEPQETPKTSSEAPQPASSSSDAPDQLGLLRESPGGLEDPQAAKGGLQQNLATAAEAVKPAKRKAVRPVAADEAKEDEGLRLPRSVQAVYLNPLKRSFEHGVPTCDLQLRSYSVRNLEFFADFALRAAYYLKLPASGPVPLPRMRELWTVPRSNFAHKKSQENFDRITLRRLIQIKDGHPDAVEVWLAYLTKHQYHGVGMKANIWDYEGLGVGRTLDATLEEIKPALEPKWAQFGTGRVVSATGQVEKAGTAR